MEPFRLLTGLVAPLDRANVDTDAIIPKQFLKSIKRSGFGPNLFDAWRYLDRGEPGDGQQPAAAQSGFRAERTALPRRADPARAAQFRLRQLARARAVGACRLRLSRDDRAVVRRHLLQQLLQERPAADRAARIAGRPAVRRGPGVPGFQADDRPAAAAGGHAGRLDDVSRSTSSRSASTACPRPRRHRAHAAARRRHPRVRGEAPGRAAVAVADACGR